MDSAMPGLGTWKYLANSDGGPSRVGLGAGALSNDTGVSKYHRPGPSPDVGK
jgi:hypothetical protein